MNAFNAWFDQREWSNPTKAKKTLEKVWKSLYDEYDLDDNLIEDVFEKIVRTVEVDNGV